MEFLAFIKENWYWIFPTTITVASAIVKLTPNETDNKILHGFIRICETIAMNNQPVVKK